MKIDLIILSKTTTEKPYVLVPERRFAVQFKEPLLFLESERPEEFVRFLKAGSYPVILDGPLFRDLRQKLGIRVETDDVAKTCALLELDSQDPSIQNFGSTVSRRESD